MKLHRLVFRPLAPRIQALPELQKPAFILGSGPLSSPPPFSDFHFLTVNGSQSIGEQWGLVPEITIMGAALAGNGLPSREAQRVITGKATDFCICIGEREDIFQFRAKFRELSYTPRILSMMPKTRREQITEQVLGAEALKAGKPSNGVFLALLALHRGATFALMSGFSLTRGGHKYNALDLPREHIDADRQLLDMAVKQQLPLFTNDPQFASESRVPLYTVPVARSA